MLCRNQISRLTITSLGLTLALAACRSGPPAAAEKPVPPPGAKSFFEKQITSMGRNERPVFSDDGKSIFFLAAERAAHKQAQVYQYVLATERERRITYHDGDDESIAPHPNGRDIYYSSSTDEIKESPDFIRQSLNQTVNTVNDFFGRPLPRTEIYKSDLNGDKIERLTKFAGYDGDVAFRRGGKKEELLFVSVRHGGMDLYTYRSGTVNRVASMKEPEWAPALSAKGELAFTRGLTAPDAAASVTPIAAIFVADSVGAKGRQLTTDNAVHLHPSWHPNNEWIIYSANVPDPKNYELYWVRKDGKCRERLTYTAENEFYPSFSPDGSTIVFTREMEGSRQVLMFTGVPAPACVEMETSAPSSSPSPSASE